jgi:hypothetical protein
MQLTTKRVTRALKRPGRYHDGHGLNLVVVNANNASWQLRYQIAGREHLAAVQANLDVAERALAVRPQTRILA